MRLTFACVVVLLAGCQAAAPGPSGKWIDWEPRDLARVEAARHELRSIELEYPDGEPITVEELIEFDPLNFVPDYRFREAFAEIDDRAVRVHHCQLGSTGSYAVTVAFTPRPTSETTAELRFLQCENDSTRKASFCEFAPETGYHLNNPQQVFRLGNIDHTVGIAIMRLLSEGSFRSEAPGFPPPDWPDGWWSEHAGRYLGTAVHNPHPNRFELSFGGCACRPYAVLEYGSPRATDEVLIVDLSVLCI
jgi:hypothetical protein